MSIRSSNPRLVGWCAVLGYALVASGLPLPFGRLPADFAAGRGDPAAARLLAGKDRSQPFPCMDKPCGCATAAQCFARCCCHTPTERLAWARARGLEAGVRAAIARAAILEAAAAKQPGASSCCAEQRRPDAEPQRCGGATPPCCTQESTGTAASSADGKSADQVAGPVANREGRHVAGRGRSVSLRAMLACGGIVEAWFAAGNAVPPRPVVLAVAAPLVGRLVVADRCGDAAPPPPDVPPPRSA